MFCCKFSEKFWPFKPVAELLLISMRALVPVLTGFITLKYAGWILDDQVNMMWHKYNGDRIKVLTKIRLPFILFIMETQKF